eukprot:CAMPEP_0182430064 /NCGR_PEP_ID=MMETSP1167-20130531/36485_1 /TAXON_ID=2988 /ORGANISM="Mallomonas Sp, Strain CCMP3275" /LENGTH=144 /DNA_ID=CAMNT_0024614675 /DNA_START=72 /DNA_END=503 /DNA_ORIENTATION=+
MASAASDVQELSPILIKSACYCLNQHSSFPFTNLFVGDETLYLKSDVDHQLLIHLVFQTYVRLHAISIIAPGDDSAPTGIKLFTNLSSPGFSDAEDLEPAQILNVGPDDFLPGNKIGVKIVKFQQVNSLSIFIEENNGEEFSVL